MKCLLLMNVISICMSSINKRPQCSSLIRWWNQRTITTVYYIFFFAMYKANSKVFNFARTLTPMEMNVLENTSFVCFEVVFQYWVLFMGRKLFQTTQRNFFSNIITWWHSNSNWRLYLGASQSVSPVSIRESFLLLFTMNGEKKIS